MCSLFLTLVAAIINPHGEVVFSQPLPQQQDQDPTQSATQFQLAPQNNILHSTVVPASIPAADPWFTTSLADVAFVEDMLPYYPEPLYEEFMGSLPTLQWLDSDFDNVLAQSGFGEYLTPP
jgi:hypothetical protein